MITCVFLVAIWALTCRIEGRKERIFSTEDPSGVTLFWGPRELYSFDIDKALKQCKIVPHIFDKSPEKLVEVLYDEDSVSDFGVYLRPDEMMIEPETVKWSHKKGHHYTVIAADPDVPTRTDINDYDYLLWLVVNAEGTSWTSDNILAPYVGPEPAFESGVHRILFLIFEQPDKIQFKEPFLTDDRDDVRRLNFTIRGFAKKYKLGHPIAINFFFCENWDHPMTDDEDDAGFTIPPFY